MTIHALRGVIATLCAALLGLFLTALIGFRMSQSALCDAVGAHLQTTAQLQINHVDTIIEHNLNQLALVNSRTQLRLSLRAFQQGEDPSERARMNKILRDARNATWEFEDIDVLDLDGEVVASTKETHLGDMRKDDPSFQKGIKGYTSQLATFVAGTPRLELSGPLILEGKTIGVLMVLARTETLNQVTADYTGLGKTGETMLVMHRENGPPIAITPLRQDREPMRAVKIDPLELRDGVLTETTDYRGKSVLAMTRKLPHLDWSIVVKIDEEEAYGAQANHMRFMFASLTLTILLTALVFVGFVRKNWEPQPGLDRKTAGTPVATET
ncbi:Cache domain-containing protein [Sulfidibacter corallicola]|uniref:Cache domain-containing protein n=1 Tax=Sulfidibacter corallicola TaxID=2818388 RepID=A0A8A4TM87_SULCO|nr:cache domain-containing protein [Sulfidibacter corallicola]QTD49981.1 cache domain-containing protein [Sulfidibacter corallicola]